MQTADVEGLRRLPMKAVETYGIFRFLECIIRKSQTKWFSTPQLSIKEYPSTENCSQAQTS